MHHLKIYLLSFLLFILPAFGFTQFDYSIDFVGGIDNNNAESASGSNYLSFIGYRVGGNFSVSIFDNVYVKTGFRYATVGTKIRREGLIVAGVIDPNINEPDQMIVFNDITSFSRRYIEIPLAIRGQFGRGKVTGFCEVGMSPHYYLHTKSIKKALVGSNNIFIDDVRDGGKQIRNAFVFSLGLNCRISDKFELFFQPTIRKYNSRRPPNTLGFTEKITNYGIEVGLRRGFYFAKID